MQSPVLEQVRSKNETPLFTLSVIVPVYNSQECLALLMRTLEESLPTIAIDYEIILVDDCSKDKSWEQLLHLSKTNKRIRAIRLMRNYGQHSALLCGIRAAKNEVIVTLDDDLQNPPSEIPLLLQKIAEGNDVVYGRPMRAEHSLLRNLSSQITKLVLKKAMGAETAQNISSFRAFKAEVCQAFASYADPYVNIDVILAWSSTKFASVPVLHEARQFGKSNYTFARLLTHALNMLTGFSVIPLRWASLNGLVCIGFGVILFAYVIGRVIIQGCPVPGFPFLASVTILFAGSQLLALGIIGEYLARMYVRTMNRPTYLIRDSIQSSDND